MRTYLYTHGYHMLMKMEGAKQNKTRFWSLIDQFEVSLPLHVGFFTHKMKKIMSAISYEFLQGITVPET